MGGGRDRDAIDQLHVQISNLLKRQSEQDFPRGSMRNGLIDGTKCQSSERKGNLFRLLCIAHTAVGSSIMKRSLSYSDQKWKRFIKFLKLYLAMEEWFHDLNDKNEVKQARDEIAKVLRMLQQLFPRPSKTNGYNIPKMHGITKMQDYIKLFGSGINFYGGPGKSAHKQFIKIPGQRTQRRVGEFAKQTALQYYHMLVSSYAAEECRISEANTKQIDFMEPKGDIERRKDDEVIISLTGKYEFIVTHANLKSMEEEWSLNVLWAYDDRKFKEGQKYKLSSDLVRILHRKFCSLAIGKHVTGFTKLVITSTTGNDTSFYAHPWFQGHEWYDWALVHFEEEIKNGEMIERFYPSKVLGFVEVDGMKEAVIQCGLEPLEWNAVQSIFFVQITLGNDFDISFVTVPIDALVHPLCVIPDCGGEPNTYFVVLPKRNWSRYFGDKI